MKGIWGLGVAVLVGCSSTTKMGEGTGAAGGSGGNGFLRDSAGAGGVGATGTQAGEGGGSGADPCAACAADGYECDGTSCLAAPDAPAAPLVDGEASAGHLDLLWSWATVPGAERYEVRLDGDSWIDVGGSVTFATEVEWGSHSIEVRACAESCSLPSRFDTRVERFGPVTGPWAGLRRALPRSPLGRPVAIGCHSCSVAADGSTLTDGLARAKIERALSRGADLVDVPVSGFGTALALCASPTDTANCLDAATLAGILESDALAASDALLSLEIVEDDAAPRDFARALLDALEQRREFARNGRPVYIRASSERLEALQAVAAALPGYPFLAPYVRLGVAYSPTAHAAVAAFQDALRVEVANHNFGWAELDHTTPNLTSLLGMGRSMGLSFAVSAIPGDDGAVHTTRLREHADLLWSDYRVDWAREAVVATNVLAHVDASRCRSPGDGAIDMFRNVGELTSLGLPVNVTPSADAPGTPSLVYIAEGEDQFGCSLRFRDLGGSGRFLRLGETVDTSCTRGGYLVSATVNFDVLSLEEGQSMVLLGNMDLAGFALALVGTASSTVLRFAVHVDGEYRKHEYEVSAVGLPGIETINDTETYHLVGAYGGGAVKLWINGQSAGDGGSYVDGVRLSSLPTLVGADPQAAGALPRFFFEGLIQEATVVDFGLSPSGELN